MKRICFVMFIGALVPAALPADPPDRAELLESPRYVEKSEEPSFVPLTAAKLQDELKVVSSRSSAVFGFNTPEVQVHLPRCDNSVYAQVEFSPARLLDVKGGEVPYERERGIYDHDLHSDELRFAPVSGKTPVAFARAEGTITLRYPVRMKTLSLGDGTTGPGGVKVAIDGPFVSWTGKEPALPEAASFTPFEQWRAFDASGRRLEKDPYTGFKMHNDVTTETYAYRGAVKEVRVDAVEEWVELEISYSLPPIAPHSDDLIGTPQEPGPAEGDTPGGKVTVRLVGAESAPAAGGAMSKDDALARLKELGYPRFDAGSFVMAAVQGKADAVRLFLAAGMPVNTESSGRTALYSAAMMGHVEAGRVLIEAGADLNKPDSTGTPPLLRLVMKCDATELVQAFIDAGADLTVELPGGVTAREMAKLTNCKENAQVLKAAGAR